MVCLLAATWVQLSVSAGNKWPHNALRHHWLMPISCHFRDCKALLVTCLTHVSGAITSVQTFTFTFTFTGRGEGNVTHWKLKLRAQGQKMQNCRNHFLAVTPPCMVRFPSSTHNNISIPGKICLLCLALLIFLFAVVLIWYAWLDFKIWGQTFWGLVLVITGVG